MDDRIRSARAIRAAEILLEAGDPDLAAGRAYYEKDLRFRKHGGVHGAIGEHFVKAKQLDQRFHRMLLDAFDKRIQGDYGVEALISFEDVEEMIGQAREFLDEARRILQKAS